MLRLPKLDNLGAWMVVDGKNRADALVKRAKHADRHNVRFSVAGAVNVNQPLPDFDFRDVVHKSSNATRHTRRLPIDALICTISTASLAENKHRSVLTMLPGAA